MSSYPSFIQINLLCYSWFPHSLKADIFMLCGMTWTYTNTKGYTKCQRCSHLSFISVGDMEWRIVDVHYFDLFRWIKVQSNWSISFYLFGENCVGGWTVPWTRSERGWTSRTWDSTMKTKRLLERNISAQALEPAIRVGLLWQEALSYKQQQWPRLDWQWQCIVLYWRSY